MLPLKNTYSACCFQFVIVLDMGLWLCWSGLVVVLEWACGCVVFYITVDMVIVIVVDFGLGGSEVVGVFLLLLGLLVFEFGE